MGIKSARKIGFWTAVAILVGSIVGIGIFFKNGSVSREADNGGVATLLAWVIGGLISLFAAISFTEIGSQKFKNVFGLAAWSEKALGKKFGYFTRFNLSFFYYGILTVIFGIFVSEALLQIFVASGSLKEQPPIWVHIIIGIAIDAFFITINHISIRGSSWVSKFSTVLKLVPLITVAIAGLALANTNHAPDTTSPIGAGHNAFTNGSSFSFTGLLAALPAVLFAYDAFLDAGTYSDKVKGGSKTVSKAIIFTLIAVLILYSIISVAHILHGAGSVGGLFEQVFPASAQKGLSIFVWVFLFISAVGVQNGVTTAAVAACEQVTRTTTWFGSTKLINKFGIDKATYFIQTVIYVFWAIIIFIPAIVLKSDAIVDCISNFPTLFFFAIYGLTIVGYGLKREKIATDKINSKLWYTSSVLAVLGILFVVAYQLFYGFTIRAFVDPSNPSHAGFLVGESLTLIEQFGIFIGSFVAFFALPLINWFLVKKFEKRQVAIDSESVEISRSKVQFVNE